MPRATVTRDVLHVHLSLREKVSGLLRDLEVPRASVVSAEVVEDGLAAARGVRAPGLALPGVTKVGTWRSRAGRQFVAVRRGVPALRLELRDAAFSSAVVSLPDAERVARELAARP